VPTRGIPFPAGDPSLDEEAEAAWRRRLLQRALEAVSTAVDGPTLFPVDDAPAVNAETEEAHA
jgi:betaine reductase